MTVRRPFIAAQRAPKVKNVIILEHTFFSSKTYSVLGNLYNVESLMYVQMQVMVRDQKDKETCTHNIEKKQMERFDGNNAGREIKIRKKTKQTRTKRDRSFAGDAHLNLNLKEVGPVRYGTWIMQRHVRKRSGMTGGVELVRKYDVA